MNSNHRLLIIPQMLFYFHLMTFFLFILRSQINLKKAGERYQIDIQTYSSKKPTDNAIVKKRKAAKRR